MTILSGVPWPPTPLTTERITLRPAEPRDRAALIELLTSSTVREHLGGPVTHSDAEAATAGPFGRVPGSFVIALDDGANAIGTVGVDHRDAERPGHLDGRADELEISYALLPGHWHQGYASEALAMVLDWISAVLDDDHVIAVTQSANAPSLRLLRRLGFTDVMTFTEFDADQALLAYTLSRR